MFEVLLALLIAKVIAALSRLFTLYRSPDSTMTQEELVEATATIIDSGRAAASVLGETVFQSRLADALGTDELVNVDPRDRVTEGDMEKLREILTDKLSEDDPQHPLETPVSDPESLSDPLPTSPTPEPSESLTEAPREVRKAADDEERRRIPYEVRRVAEAEVSYVAQQTILDLIEAHPQAVGWVREIESDACELCQWWRHGGKVWNKHQRMAEHPGCRCEPAPVFEVTNRNVQKGVTNKEVSNG